MKVVVRRRRTIVMRDPCLNLLLTGPIRFIRVRLTILSTYYYPEAKHSPRR
jgi:hypothetical protein